LTTVSRTLVTLGVATALVGGALLIFLMAPTTPMAHAGDRKDCSDFPTQKRAQRWFKHHHPRRDPSGLDSDNDRIACEDNPCPCSRRWHRQHGKLAAVKVDVLVEPARATATVA
jgi:hypothetical protein